MQSYKSKLTLASKKSSQKSLARQSNSYASRIENEVSYFDIDLPKECFERDSSAVIQKQEQEDKDKEIQEMKMKKYLVRNSTKDRITNEIIPEEERLGLRPKRSVPKKLLQLAAARAATKSSILGKEVSTTKTEEIKMKLVEGCKTKLEQLFFFIKDDAYENFVNLMNKSQIGIDEKDKNGNSLLSLAVQSNSIKIVTHLLGKGAKVNMQNHKKNTPLHFALAYRNWGITDILLQFGADEEIRNSDGLTPWQCINGNYKIN